MRKLIRFYDNDGFTVIELLMAIIILGVVMAAITTMIVQSFNVFDSSTRRMSAGQLAELTLSEVGGYLRTVTPYKDGEGNFNDNFEDDKWKFNGYHPANEDGESKFVIELNNDRLLLTVKKEDGENVLDRVILNNILNNNHADGFKIEYLGDNEFEIFIRVQDGEGNIAIKRSTIRSRNL